MRPTQRFTRADSPRRHVDAQMIIASSADAAPALRYLTRYLTKAVLQTYPNPEDPDVAYKVHSDRLHVHFRWLPCSPGCAKWLRHVVQARDTGLGPIFGACRSKTHDQECFGLGGRRVLVSRHWTGKSLTDHRAERAAAVHRVLEAAGIEVTEVRSCAPDVLAADGRRWLVWAVVDAHEDAYDCSAVIVAGVGQARWWSFEHGVLGEERA